MENELLLNLDMCRTCDAKCCKSFVFISKKQMRNDCKLGYKFFVSIDNIINHKNSYTCSMLDTKTNKCMSYNNRPWACKVYTCKDEQYPLWWDKLTSEQKTKIIKKARERRKRCIPTSSATR